MGKDLGVLGQMDTESWGQAWRMGWPSLFGEERLHRSATLGKLPDGSVPQFLHQQNQNVTCQYFIVVRIKSDHL